MYKTNKHYAKARHKKARKAILTIRKALRDSKINLTESYEKYKKEINRH